MRGKRKHITGMLVCLALALLLTLPCLAESIDLFRVDDDETATDPPMTVQATPAPEEELPEEDDDDAAEEASEDTAEEAEAESLVIDAVYRPRTPYPFGEDEEVLEIWFPRIKDADAALILCDGQAVLIDAADEKQSAAVLKLLEYLEIESLDAVINSHPHHDHLGGFARIADEIYIGALYLAFPTGYNQTSVTAEEKAAECGIPVLNYGDGDGFRVGGAMLTAINKSSPEDSENDRSTAISLRFGERQMLFLGDLEAPGLAKLYEQTDPSLLQAEVVKHPHHGISSLMSLPTLESVKISVITNSTRVKTSINNLRHSRINPLLTYRKWVHLVTNGEKWYAEAVKVPK